MEPENVTTNVSKMTDWVMQNSIGDLNNSGPLFRKSAIALNPNHPITHDCSKNRLLGQQTFEILDP